MACGVNGHKAAQYSFHHPVLGELHGVKRGPEIVQFRGIPFASIPARFRQSVLAASLPHQPFDATKPGPTCPQLTSQTWPSFWEGPLASDGIALEMPSSDEFGCLNLNITVPTECLEGNRQHVPVLVYIHGGGFTVGCSSLQVAGREMYDGMRLLQRGMADGRPLVVVSINYRLGPLGFLASEELQAFNRSHNEAVGNYGLHDQRQAIEWVSRFIGAFGGDADNITVQGGSAGGTSCHFQAHFKDTKIKRAILSSGTSLALGAMPLSYLQERYDGFAEKFCPANSEGLDAVHALQSIPVEEFVNQPITAFYNPLVDNDWVKERTATALQKFPTSVELMVGSCAFEQDLTLSMMGAMDSHNPRSDQYLRDLIKEMIETAGLNAKVESILSPSVLEGYGAGPTLTTPSKALEIWATLVADVVFRIPPYVIGLLSAKSKVYVYDFQATNPFSGWPLGYGKSNHAISDIFFFNVAEDLVPERHKAEYSGAAQELQRIWIKFCHGELAWEPFDTTSQERLGPVYSLANHGKIEKHESLEDALGTETLRRWTAVIDVIERL